jgi:putative tryptophan/tyrosine transport system substrate-binding protein
MKRREFLAMFAGAAADIAYPRRSHGQPRATPVIGFLSSLSEARAEAQLTNFRRGLSEVGFAEGRNLTIDFRWSEGRYELLPAMADDLVRRDVNLILARGPPAALAARASSTSIPTVFVVGFDPVAGGLVASLNQPGGNATGVTLMTAPLGQKRLELLREIAPKAGAVALLANPVSPDAAQEIVDIENVARALRLQLERFNATNLAEIETAFARLVEQRPDALVVGSDPFLLDQRDKIATLAAKLRVPTIYPFREFAASGGLISYGTSIGNAYRQAGIYAGQILKGTKPADLPVVQPTTFELVINLTTAKMLGIEIPATLHARSDEVIE